MRPLALFASALIALAACGGAGSGEAPGGAGAPASAAAPMAGATTVTGAGLTFDLPPGWEQQPPTSSMRLAQSTIPGPGGPGELAVFFFGAGSGGGVEANLERWINQVESPPGIAPQRDAFEVGGLQVTWVEAAGTLLPSGMGMGPSEPEPDSRLFGAVVEGPGGPWFFKATGPDATLSAARDAFLALLRSTRAAQPAI